MARPLDSRSSLGNGSTMVATVAGSTQLVRYNRQLLILCSCVLSLMLTSCLSAERRSGVGRGDSGAPQSPGPARPADDMSPGSDPTDDEDPSKDDATSKDDAPGPATAAIDAGPMGSPSPIGPDMGRPACAVGSAGCQCTAGGACDPGLSCASGVCASVDECEEGSAGCGCRQDATCEPKLTCVDDLCVVPPDNADCQQSLSVGGTLAAGDTEITFDSASVVVEHKRDVDVVEDGCIRSLEFSFQSGSGCLLTVFASEVLTARGELLVTDVAFSADSQCPNFLDAKEGLYQGSDGTIDGSWVFMDPTTVPERNVAVACFGTAFEISLNGTIETDDGRTLSLAGTSLQLTGDVLSTSMEGSCPVECTRDAHCGSVQACVDGACVDLCTDDSQCGDGTICDSAGSCVAGCRDDSDCGANQICSSTSCVAGCRDDSDCGADQICVSTSCVAGCRDDSDCGANQICDSTSCVTGCRDNDGCGANEVCEATSCVPGCRSDNACGANEICESGKCTPGCTGDGQCSGGEVCQSGRCVSGCRANDDCNSDEICKSGDCIPGCRATSYCPAQHTCVNATCVPNDTTYKFCSPAIACPEETMICVGNDLDYAFCSPACVVVSDCPTPTTGEATPICLAGQCVLECEPGPTCPVGMFCGSTGWCQWYTGN